MGQRSDAKSNMVTAAQQLFRERGYHATALSDVLALSGAPRGSVYFHFPGGKAQLAVEVAQAYARDQTDQIEREAETSSSALELVSAFVTRTRDNFIKSDYSAGCTVAPMVLEGAKECAEIAAASSAALTVIIESLASQFTTLGMTPAAARELAEVVLSGVEGALVTGRAFASSAPFDSVLAALKNYAAQFDMAVTNSASEH